MKRFVKYLVVFFLPLLVGAVVMEIMLRHIPNDYQYKSDYLDQNSNDIRQLYLGNSHIFYGINPDYLPDGSFNASHISQSLDYDLALLEKYKDNWKNLNCIVLPIDYFSLFSRIDTGIESWRAKNYTIYYDLYDGDISNHFETTSVKLKPNLQRIYRYYAKDERSDLTCSKLGWGMTYNSKNHTDLELSGKKAAQRHTITDEETYEKNTADLKKIIAFAVQRNIKLILVTCPAYQTYRENLNPRQLERTFQTINSLTANNPDVHYCNLLSDPDFIAADFYDADHLNEIGAAKFTIKMKQLTKR